MPILESPDVPPSVKADLSRQSGLMNTREWGDHLQ